MSTNDNNTLDIEQIESLLNRRLRGRIRNLTVQIGEDGLVLEGISDTYYAKQLAQHAAMEVTGLAIQANNIKVY